MGRSLDVYSQIKTHLSKSRDRKIAAIFFYAFCMVHFAIWTILPFAIRGNVPFDTIEGIAWGFQWQWGYDKHPPLAAWLCALITKMFHLTGLPVYILAQLSTILAFWAVWQLAKRFLPPWHALISVVLLEGVIYYNLLTPKFNPTTLMTPLWAIASFVFYLALTQKKYYQWLLLGLICALALLAKLQSVLLFIAFLCILLSTRTGRNSFKSPGLYLGVVIGIALLIPHMVWQYHHNFSEVIYAINRTNEHAEIFLSRLRYPFYLLISELGAILGLILLLVPFLKGKRIPLSLTPFQWRFILLINIVPLGFTLLYSFIFNSDIHSTWCTPYFFGLGILAMVLLRPHLTRKNVKFFSILWAIIFLIIPLGRYSYLFFNPYITHLAKPDAYFPGKKIAPYVILQWQKKYPNKPLKYIAGSHYLVANIVAYNRAPSLIPFFDWRRKESPWINLKQLKKDGAVFTWIIDSAKSEVKMPWNVAKRFPKAKISTVHCFSKLTKASVKPLCIGLAFLPPQT